MISQRCRHQGRGSVFNRCFTSSIDTCAAAWVTLAIPFLLLLCQDLLLILPQIADWYESLLILAPYCLPDCCSDSPRLEGTESKVSLITTTPYSVFHHLHPLPGPRTLRLPSSCLHPP